MSYAYETNARLACRNFCPSRISTAHDSMPQTQGSLPVGVGVFLRRENPEFAILAAILENTRRGGAGRAIVDKEATRGEGDGRREKKEGKNAYWITIPR